MSSPESDSNPFPSAPAFHPSVRFAFLRARWKCPRARSIHCRWHRPRTDCPQRGQRAFLVGREKTSGHAWVTRNRVQKGRFGEPSPGLLFLSTRAPTFRPRMDDVDDADDHPAHSIVSILVQRIFHIVPASWSPRTGYARLISSIIGLRILPTPPVRSTRTCQYLMTSPSLFSTQQRQYEIS